MAHVENFDFLDSDEPIPESELRTPIPPIPPTWDTIKNPSPGLIGYTRSHIARTAVSSGLEGSTCRGRRDEAIQWAMELCWTGQDSFKNLVKILIKFAVNDIGPADPSAFWIVYQLCEGVKGTDPHNQEELLAVATSIEYLCKARKTRLIRMSLLNSEIEGIPTKALDVAESPEQIYSLLCGAINSLDLQECMRLSEYLYHSKAKVARNFNGTKTSPKWLIWKAIEECIKTPYTNKICNIVCANQWSMNNLGRILYCHIYHVVCCTDYDQNLIPDAIPLNQELWDTISSCYNRIEMYGIPDYAYDRHTTEGQKKGRGFIHYLTEVCKYDNEDDRWTEETQESLETFITWYNCTGGDKQHGKKKLS